MKFKHFHPQLWLPQVIPQDLSEVLMALCRRLIPAVIHSFANTVAG